MSLLSKDSVSGFFMCIGRLRACLVCSHCADTPPTLDDQAPTTDEPSEQHEAPELDYAGQNVLGSLCTGIVNLRH
jgi:hypothetical protein